MVSTSTLLSGASRHNVQWSKGIIATKDTRLFHPVLWNFITIIMQVDI